MRRSFGVSHLAWIFTDARWPASVRANTSIGDFSAEWITAYNWNRQNAFLGVISRAPFRSSHDSGATEVPNRRRPTTSISRGFGVAICQWAAHRPDIPNLANQSYPDYLIGTKNVSRVHMHTHVLKGRTCWRNKLSHHETNVVRSIHC